VWQVRRRTANSVSATNHVVVGRLILSIFQTATTADDDVYCLPKATSSKHDVANCETTHVYDPRPTHGTTVCIFHPIHLSSLAVFRVVSLHRTDCHNSTQLYILLVRLACTQRCGLLSFFTIADNTRGIKGHSRKLVKFRCTRDCCIYFFPIE